MHALVDAVAAANPRTVVTVESSGPVLMPWAGRVAGILEAWYPGTEGGHAIANVLFGRVNPSGRLPATFPQSESQLPRPVRPGGATEQDVFTLNYSEGAAVGYKWFDKNNLQPLFPFGYGLSYTTFAFGAPTAAAHPDGSVGVDVPVRNSGPVRGMEVAQVYVSPVGGGWEAPKRLGGFQKVDLAPGQAKTVHIKIDPRLLAMFDQSTHQWRIAPGSYRLVVGDSSRDSRGTAIVRLPGLTLPSDWRPGLRAAAPQGSPAERGL